MLNYNSSSEILEFIQDTSPDPVEEYIKSFSKLWEGWNFGEGRKPTDELISRAIQIYKLGKSFGLIGSAFPVGDGEIEISFSYQDHFIDLLITNENSYDYTYEIGTGDQYNEIEHIENIALKKFESKLKALEELKRCDSLEYSMLDGTLIGIKEDSRAVALEEAVKGSPSLIEIVWPRIMAPQYAGT